MNAFKRLAILILLTLSLPAAANTAQMRNNAIMNNSVSTMHNNAIMNNTVSMPRNNAVVNQAMPTRNIVIPQNIPYVAPQPTVLPSLPAGYAIIIQNGVVTCLGVYCAQPGGRTVHMGY